MGGESAAVVALNQHSNAKYEVLRIVNRGGMGEIALARVKGTKGFEKLVVLKRLRADTERADHRAMFDVEAELMSRIEHPNIVEVFDQPVIDNIPYLAMSYVRGRNLDQLIRRAKGAGDSIPVVLALTIIAETLRGLAFIHRLKDEEKNALGVVHQDITPSNILVSFFGEVKITDFGIAYVTSRDGGLRKGVLKGKPRYVAPEVLAGRRVNNRVDIYGVGVVLYEMLKGQSLFARPKVQDTLTAVAKNEVPDFSTDLPQASDGVHQLLRKSLSKDPADRFRTAEEMNQVVQAELAKLGGPLSPSRIGYIMRERFKGDPDAPELDADVDDGAISVSILPNQFSSPDLEQTLSELDRLLGADSSSDLFALPPEIANELAEIEDMEPFPAHTPLPDLALVDPQERELIEQAELGASSPSVPVMAAVPPPLITTPDGRTPSLPPMTALPPPRGSIPPADLATIEDALTDPMMPPPRRTRPPIGSAVFGARDVISDDLQVPRQFARVPSSVTAPKPALDSDDVGRATDDVGSGRLSQRPRRADADGTSPGEYAYRSSRAKATRPDGTEIPSSIPAPSTSADFAEIDTNLDPPSIDEAPTLHGNYGDTSMSERRRMQWFATGMIVGVLLGAMISVFVVLAVTK